MSLEKNPTTGQILEHPGPIVEFLTAPQDAQNDFCVLKGIIPPASVFHCTLTLTQRTFSSQKARSRR